MFGAWIDFVEAQGEQQLAFFIYSLPWQNRNNDQFDFDRKIQIQDVTKTQKLDKTANTN